MKHFLSIVTALAGIALSGMAQDAPVSVKIDIEHPGPEIPPDYLGLSFEVTQLLPRPDGSHYFSAENKALLRLFRVLGIKNLRLGGNTSDRNADRLPSESDIDSLFGFAQAANVKVIYCLRLHDGDPEADARLASYIMDRYAPLVECFSIGQEPSAYPKPYPYETYRKEWKRFADVIAAAVPEVKFCGPSVHNNATWARRFMDDFGASNHVTMVTEHLYPGGAGGKVPTPEIGRDRMLSNSFVRVYEKLRDGVMPQARGKGLPFRLEEVNNYFNGGATDVSSTFAAALWGLDFSWWWVEQGAAGVNFHTGDKVAAGAELRPSRYTAYYTDGKGFAVRPLGYGLAAFALADSGRILRLTVSKPEDLDLDAYATASPDRHLYVTLINKSHGPSARNADVSIFPSAAAEAMYLRAPKDDIAAATGVTLGGAAIDSTASWTGSWTKLPARKPVPVPPASAVVVRIAGD